MDWWHTSLLFNSFHYLSWPGDQIQHQQCPHVHAFQPWCLKPVWWEHYHVYIYRTQINHQVDKCLIIVLAHDHFYLGVVLNRTVLLSFDKVSTATSTPFLHAWVRNSQAQTYALSVCPRNLDQVNWKVSVPTAALLERWATDILCSPCCLYKYTECFSPNRHTKAYNVILYLVDRKAGKSMGFTTFCSIINDATVSCKSTV